MIILVKPFFSPGAIFLRILYFINADLDLALTKNLPYEEFAVVKKNDQKKKKKKKQTWSRSKFTLNIKIK